MSDKIKLKKGDKVIERNKVDYDINKVHWDNRGWSVVGSDSFLDKIKKKAPKKKKSK